MTGGLQMPSLQWYYWSAQFRSAMFYFVTHLPPTWVYIEQASISKLPLNLYLYSADFKTLKKQQLILSLKTLLTYGLELIDILVIHLLSLSSPLFGVMYGSLLAGQTAVFKSGPTGEWKRLETYTIRVLC